MTDLERRAYGRGYHAGLHRRWPAHIPPLPPDPVILGLMVALKTLRDGIDGELAKFGGDDPIELALAPAIAAADAALAQVTAWLLAQDGPR